MKEFQLAPTLTLTDPEAAGLVAALALAAGLALAAAEVAGLDLAAADAAGADAAAEGASDGEVDGAAAFPPHALAIRLNTTTTAASLIGLSF